MTPPPLKNLPVESAETAEYWAGCRRGELLIQRCGHCGRHQFYPRLLCGACGHRGLEWVAASGRGSISSFTIVRRAVSEAYAPELPYVVALIHLEEGPTMMSNVVDCAPEALRIGLPVTVTFKAWSAEMILPVFRPAGR